MIFSCGGPTTCIGWIHTNNFYFLKWVPTPWYLFRISKKLSWDNLWGITWVFRDGGEFPFYDNLCSSCYPRGFLGMLNMVLDDSLDLDYLTFACLIGLFFWFTYQTLVIPCLDEKYNILLSWELFRFILPLNNICWIFPQFIFIFRLAEIQE